MSQTVAPPTPAIQVADLTVRLDGRMILDRVTLNVAAGELVGLIGPNGAGKTTLLRAIAGLVEADRGSVRVHGIELSALSVRERGRRLARVSQNVPPDLAFRGQELVLMGRHPHLGRFAWEGAADQAIARQAMARTGTLPFAERRLDELSGGERQLVVLARALAQQAGILLLDEVTANLDLRHQMDVLRIVREQVGRGIAGLMAIHDLTSAGRFCDRLVLLRAGTVQSQGPPDDVLNAAALSRVYGTPLTVIREPVTGRPVVLPAAADERAPLAFVSREEHPMH